MMLNDNDGDGEEDGYGDNDDADDDGDTDDDDPEGERSPDIEGLGLGDTVAALSALHEPRDAVERLRHDQGNARGTVRR